MVEVNKKSFKKAFLENDLGLWIFILGFIMTLANLEYGYPSFMWLGGGLFLWIVSSLTFLTEENTIEGTLLRLRREYLDILADNMKRDNKKES